MTWNRQNVLRLSAAIMALTCILIISSNAADSWGVITEYHISSEVGLWRGCLSSGGDKLCLSMGCSNLEPDGPWQCDKLRVARGGMTLACLLSGISTVLIVWLSLPQGENASSSFLRWAKIFAFGSLVSVIAGVSVGIAFVTYASKYSLGGAAILGIVTVLINLIGAIQAARIPTEYNSM